eukprot:gene14009-21387_t
MWHPSPRRAWTAADGDGDTRVGVVAAFVDAGTLSNFVKGLGLVEENSRVYAVQQHEWRGRDAFLVATSVGDTYKRRVFERSPA